MTETGLFVTPSICWQNRFDRRAAIHDRRYALDFTTLDRKNFALPGFGKCCTLIGIEAAVLLVQVGGFSTSAEAGRKLLERVKSDVRALDPARYAPGMQIGYAGDVAISVEEMSALIQDLSTSSVVVIVAVVLVIIVYYRWTRSVFALIPPLLLGTVYAFGVASLPRGARVEVECVLMLG